MALQEFWTTHRHGSFHAELGVPQGMKIPIDMLQRIVAAYDGETIYNPVATTKAKKYLKVTKELKQKARFLINMRKRSI